MLPTLRISKLGCLQAVGLATPVISGSHGGEVLPGQSSAQAEQVFGWSRHTVALGLHERRTGILCLGAQEAYCGNKRLARSATPRRPRLCAHWRRPIPRQIRPCAPPLTHTRLTAAEAIKQLRALGKARRGSALAQHHGAGAQSQRLPAAAGAQGQAPKKVPETDAIFANLREQDTLA